MKRILILFGFLIAANTAFSATYEKVDDQRYRKRTEVVETQDLDRLILQRKSLQIQINRLDTEISTIKALGVSESEKAIAIAEEKIQ